MTLTSLSFYLLVLALLVLYYLVPKRFQWVVLLIGSYAFYAFVCLRYMGFIVITTLTTYFGARGMDAMTARMEQTVAAHKQDWERDERKAYKKRCKSRRKALMIGILVFNFGILAVLKYYNFFAESMEALFASMGLTVSLGHIGLLLPLGISFYTFQSMGYVLDVYREKVPAERNVGKLALFVSFFPQIIQGPIGVYDQLAHQLYDAHKYNFDNIRYGAELILWGFFKKLVIADRAVGMIHTVAGAYTDYAGTYVLLAALVYALQLYADFSGGIDKFVGPTGGFLISFPIMAYIIGLGVEHRDAFKGAFPVAVVVGTVVNYIVGVILFVIVAHSTVSVAVSACVLPFIPTAIIKAVLACVLGLNIRKRIPGVKKA